MLVHFRGLISKTLPGLNFHNSRCLLEYAGNVRFETVPDAMKRVCQHSLQLQGAHRTHSV